jgi:hypothetical protein
MNLSDCRCIQSAGRVKSRTTVRIALENAIHHDAVEVQMSVEQRTETVDEDHGAEVESCTGAGTVLSQHPLNNFANLLHRPVESKAWSERFGCTVC